MKQSYRYPGTQSFQKEDEGIFFGREEDIRNLLRLIRLEQLVVLYGKSGLGKTSLLNAGLLPKLGSAPAIEEEDGYENAYPTDIREVRFGAYQQGISEQSIPVLRQQFQSELPVHPLLTPLIEESFSLWHHFKNKQLHERSNCTTLLVFDQFEELFTYPEQDIEAFKKEFSSLLNGNAPEEFQKKLISRLRNDRKAFSREDKQWLNKPLNIKVIIGIRSDRLSLLDLFTDQLPNMLVNLYELKPLNRIQAKSAIVNPAAESSTVFFTPPFTYEHQALETILDELSNQQGEIESFQLQLLCQYLENQVRENPDRNRIQINDFGGREGIQTILNTYYERELDKLSPKDQIVARRFIEEGLIANEKRVALAAGSEQSRFGVSAPLLQHLLNSRLIRAENIHLGKIYELSHDTLVEPVLKSYEKRKAEEEKQKIARELAEQREQLRQEKKRRQRARLFAILGFTLFLSALIAGLFALRNAQIAKRQERQAKATALAAKAWAIYRYDHTLAFRIAESALKVDPTNSEVKNTILNIVNSPKTSFYQKVLQGHRFHIEDIAYSPDDAFFATACFDSDVRIWSPEGNLIKRFMGKSNGDHLPGHKGSVTGISFSPDGKRLVSVGEDKRIKIWDLERDSLYKDFQGHERNIRAVDFSHHHEWFVTAGIDAKAKIWTIEGLLLSTLSAHQEAITDVAVSPDDLYILTGSIDGTAILWNSSGKAVKTFYSDGGSILSLSFFPDSKHFVLGKQNKTAEIWSVEGEKIRSMGGHNGQITKVAISPDGTFILTASDDATAKIWNIDGEEILTLTGHRKRLQAIAISPDSKTILTGGFDFDVKIWDVDFNLDIQKNKHSDHVFSIDVSADNTQILTGSKDNSAKLWDFSGRMIMNFQDHQSIVQSAFFVPERPEIVTASFDGAVRVWNFDGRKVLHLDHGEPVFSARSTPNRERIITGSWSGKISLWDQDGVLVKQWQAARSSVVSIHLNPDYTRIASAQGNTVKIWTMEGELLDSIVNENVEKIYQVFFSKDGQSLYTAAEEFPVRKWHLNGEPEKVFFGHFDVVYWIAEHPTQPLIATAGWDKTVKIWNQEGEVVQDFSHTRDNGFYSIAFSKDGKHLITGSHDNIGRIWDMEGHLVTALGERVNIKPVSEAQGVAPLSNIPFSMSELDIPMEYSAFLYEENVQLYLNEGQRFVERAKIKRSKLSEGISQFDQALSWYQKALNLNSNDTLIHVATYLADTYKEKGEMLFIHRQFREALDCFSKGLVYEQTDYLLILQTLAYLFNGQFQEAEILALKYKDEPVTQIDYYDNFREAYLGELDYFYNQFNLTHSDVSRFSALLGE